MASAVECKNDMATCSPIDTPLTRACSADVPRSSAEARRLHREAKALEIVKAIRPEPDEFAERPMGKRDREIQEILDAPSHIYFVYSAGKVKIGFSTNWRQRVEPVCQGCSHHSELVLVMPGDREMESGYHKLFAEYRDGGEWFRLNGYLRKFLDWYASPEGRETLDLAHKDYLDCLPALPVQS